MDSILGDSGPSNISTWWLKVNLVKSQAITVSYLKQRLVNLHHKDRRTASLQFKKIGFNQK